MVQRMRLIIVTLVFLLCAVLTTSLEQTDPKTTNGEDLTATSLEQTDLKTTNGEVLTEQVNQGIESGGGVEDPDDSGSSFDADASEGSAESGSGADEDQPQIAPPKPIGFPRDYRGPVTITPMEPRINRQRPYRRRCFFCFPRGRLGRVEVTAPGGPFLMNTLGTIPGYRMAKGPFLMNTLGTIPGYGRAMGYPDMGGLGAGPGYPDMGMGYPSMGPPPWYGDARPCCGGPCCGGERPSEDPMTFHEISEGTAGPAKVSPKVTADKPMNQAPNKAIQPPSKVIGQPPNMGIQPPPNKPLDQPPNKAMQQSQNIAPNKAVSDELKKHPLRMRLNKAIKQATNKKLGDKVKAKVNERKPEEIWMNI